MKAHRGEGTFGIVLSPCGFLLTAILVAFSYRFLDERIAWSVYRWIRSHWLLSRYTSDIPDLLLPAVLFLSVVMLVSYVHRLRSGIRDDLTWFYRLSGTALPIAYAMKTLLKHIFGRITTRAWLENPTASTFHWFHGGRRYDGFPSGHMVVFASLAGACWIFFPRYRLACVLLALGLGVALIVTDYHFLSDVIAGGYLGLMTVAGTNRSLWILSCRDAEP